ncbi:MAG: sugar phosphate permease [Arenicella sp.]|jgi:sugar phosphate permease
MSVSSPSTELTLKQRYLKLAVLVIVAGNIYPLIYLRQNFEISIVDAFGITSAQLNQNYVWLGIIYMLTYVPSGWLADRVSPRVLMSFSLLFAGLLGVWFSTLPSPESLRYIFIGWGIAAGLTFWSALIKATALLARPEEQGRFFGILDGGRGLVEAILASIAVAIFAYYTSGVGEDTTDALVKVIWLYVGMMLLLAPITYFILGAPDKKINNIDDAFKTKQGDAFNRFISDISMVVSKPEIWLCALCIMTGYQLFWATYSFSAYMQTEFGLTALTVGSITVAKLWMRPIGAASAGFAGDFLDREKVLAILMVLASLALAGLAFMPVSVGAAFLLAIVLVIGFLTYAVRGIFWATLESCNISNNVKGLAIGLISLIGYAPDVYLPLLNNYLLEMYPGKTGYAVYYNAIAFMGLLGALAAWRLKQRVAKRRLLVI